MKAKVLFPAILLIMASVSSALSQDQSESNDVFVKNSFFNLADSLLADLNPPENLSLIFKCSDCPVGFFSNILVSVLKQKASNLYIDNEDSRYDKLEINLYDYDFYFSKTGGSLFSSGQLNRNFNAAAFATLLSTESKVLWQNEVEEKFSEKVEWDKAREQEKRESGIFSAPLPSTNRSRVWEPLIISGLLGGLVYLFFASR